MTTTLDQRYLTFSLGPESYGIPLLSVREVIAVPEITPMPFTPSYFLGLMNLRGQVISVIDLRTKLGIKSLTATENAVIICELQSGHLGILVDSVDAVLTPAADEISTPPDVTGSLSMDCVFGVYRHETKLILLIDIEKTLSGEDRKAMSKRSPAAVPIPHKVA